MLCFNRHMPLSCYEEPKRDLITIEDKDTNVNFKYELENIFTLLAHSENKNRLSAIQSAKNVFNLDCHDLCHIYKKELIFKNNQTYHGLVQVLEVAEFTLNGWEVYQLSVPSGSGIFQEPKRPIIVLTLIKGHSEINMKLPEEMRTFVTHLLDKDYKLKNYAYRYILLNWDK